MDLLIELDKRMAALSNTAAEQAKTLLAAGLPDQVKAAVAAELATVRTELASIKDMHKRVERERLPGLEYAKNGEAEKFSIWRAALLHAELQRDSRAWDRKEFGLEVEAMRQVREARSQLASHNIGSTSTGGVFVPNTVMMDSIIPELAARSVVEQAGASSLSGLVGNFDWPVDQGGIAVSEIDTESEQSATETSDTFKLISVKAHTVSGNCSLTRGMRNQSAEAMEPWIRAKLASKLALKQDQHALEGSGVGAIPRGIINTTGIGTQSWSGLDYGPSITGSSTGQNIDLTLRTMAYAPLIANFMETGGRPGWIAQPQVGLKIASVQDKESRPVFGSNSSAMLTNLMGVPFWNTTNVTAATFTSSNRFLVYAADWAKLRICRWGGMDFRAGYVGSDMLADVTTIAAFMDHDILVEQPKAFVRATSLTAA